RGCLLGIGGLVGHGAASRACGRTTSNRDSTGSFRTCRRPWATFMPRGKPVGQLLRAETFLPLAERPSVLLPLFSPSSDVGRGGTSLAGECLPGVLDEGHYAPGGPAGSGDPDRVW